MIRSGPFLHWVGGLHGRRKVDGMFAIIGATVFFGGAAFAMAVIVQMVRGYWPLIAAALGGTPLPRTFVPAAPERRRTRPASTFTPERLAPARAAA
jgi:hypothetical protein